MKSKYLDSINVDERHVTKLIDKVRVLVRDCKSVRSAHRRTGIVKHIRRRVRIIKVYTLKTEQLRLLDEASIDNDLIT